MAIPYLTAAWMGILAGCLLSCSTSPPLVWEQGEMFWHGIITHKRASNSERLHIYIEGDGRPWLSTERIATDPTSRQLLMWQLLQLDKQDAVYIGRPCYFDPLRSNCSAIWWTHKRYAAKIVASMAAVIQKKARKYKEIIIIGHSGGGTLAVLLAPRIERLLAVITLAGNLDVSAWTSYHHYSPLRGSLDPTQDISIPVHIRHWHYLGEQDKNILPIFIDNFLIRQSGGKRITVPGTSHNQGWEKHWPEILQRLAIIRR